MVVRIKAKKDFRNSLIYLGRRHHCPCCQGNYRVFIDDPVTYSKFDTCPGCGSNSHERLMWEFLVNRTVLLDPPGSGNQNNLVRKKLGPEANSGSSATLSLLYVNPEPILESLLGMIDHINVEPVELSSGRLPVEYPDENFDVILTNNIRDEAINQPELLPELRRILKPGQFEFTDSGIGADQHERSGSPYSHGSPEGSSKNIPSRGSAGDSNADTRLVLSGWAVLKAPGSRETDEYIEFIDRSGFVVKPDWYVREMGDSESKRLGLDTYEALLFCMRDFMVND